MSALKKIAEAVGGKVVEAKVTSTLFEADRKILAKAFKLTDNECREFNYIRVKFDSSKSFFINVTVTFGSTKFSFSFNPENSKVRDLKGHLTAFDKACDGLMGIDREA